jgi:hypothetical protein
LKWNQATHQIFNVLPNKWNSMAERLPLKKVPQDLTVVVTEKKNVTDGEVKTMTNVEETDEVDVVKVVEATELNVEEDINALPLEHLSFFYRYGHFFDVVLHLL